MRRKDQIIQDIQRINRSARRDWLEAFDEPALARYLAHLRKSLEPRGGRSFWVRTGGTPPIVTRRRAG